MKLNEVSLLTRSTVRFTHACARLAAAVAPAAAALFGAAALAALGHLHSVLRPRTALFLRLEEVAEHALDLCYTHDSHCLTCCASSSSCGGLTSHAELLLLTC